MGRRGGGHQNARHHHHHARHHHHHARRLAGDDVQTQAPLYTQLPTNKNNNSISFSTEELVGAVRQMPWRRAIAKPPPCYMLHAAAATAMLDYAQRRCPQVDERQQKHAALGRRKRGVWLDACAVLGATGMQFA